MNDHGIGGIYEEIAEWFDQNRLKSLEEKPYLEALLAQCPPNPSVLDVGCGSGEPIARFLIERGCRLTGIDGSASMIALCQQRFPDMTWMQTDMRSVQLTQPFDAIIAWDSFFHLPHDAQRAMFPVFSRQSADGGVLLFTSGNEHSVAYGVMNGHTVYHASLDTAEYRALLNAHGFEVLIHNRNDVTCGEHTVWLAQKRISASG